MRVLSPIVAVVVATAMALGSVSPAAAAPPSAAGPAPVSSAAASSAAGCDTLSPGAAINNSVANARRSGVTQAISVVDRGTGTLVGSTANRDSQMASESLMKLFLAAYYLVLYGGYQRTPADVKNRAELHAAVLRRRDRLGPVHCERDPVDRGQIRDVAHHERDRPARSLGCGQDHRAGHDHVPVKGREGCRGRAVADPGHGADDVRRFGRIQPGVRSQRVGRCPRLQAGLGRRQLLHRSQLCHPHGRLYRRALRRRPAARGGRSLSRPDADDGHLRRETDPGCRPECRRDHDSGTADRGCRGFGSRWSSRRRRGDTRGGRWDVHPDLRAHRGVPGGRWCAAIRRVLGTVEWQGPTRPHRESGPVRHSPEQAGRRHVSCRRCRRRGCIGSPVGVRCTSRVGLPSAGSPPRRSV